MKVYRCKEQGCHELAEKGKRYCSKHAPLHYNFPKRTHEEKLESYKKYNEQSRDQEANAFYHSKQWTKVRNYVANRDTYTSAITNKVVQEKALIVDHIIPRRLCENALDSSNLWCLSRKEHLIKTKIEESLTDNQLKHVSREWWIKVIKERLK